MAADAVRWLWAGVLAGCMAAPDYKTCDELPPGTPGCGLPCSGGAEAPCNGCPAGTVVPEGWVCIPAGSFQMGSPSNEVGRINDETQHLQDLGVPYLMKVTEVTQGEYAALMGQNPSRFGACGSTCPVETVDWYEAVAYSNALSSAEGLARCYANAEGDDYDSDDADGLETPVWRDGAACGGYRLPTEAEWENAARAGTVSASYDGPVEDVGCVFDASLDPIAWYCGNAEDTPQPVHGKRVNAWGLADMLGNVWEWCWDWYAAYPGAPPANHAGPAAGDGRVVRGGSWYNHARVVRAAVRNRYYPGTRYGNVGFRPVRSVSP
jgi:formylglycine-generating enzyme required for sulfatase activity